MEIDYHPVALRSPLNGDVERIPRPLVPFEIVGPAGGECCAGLLDSGADYCVFPIRLARRLGIELRPATVRGLKAYGGAVIEASVGIATLALETPTGRLEWTEEFLFNEFAAGAAEVPVLGYAGFMERFTIVLDGENARMTLTPNSIFDETE